MFQPASPSSGFDFLESVCLRPKYKANIGDNTIIASEALNGVTCIPKGLMKIDKTIQNMITVKAIMIRVSDADGWLFVFFIQKFINCTPINFN